MRSLAAARLLAPEMGLRNARPSASRQIGTAGDSSGAVQRNGKESEHDPSGQDDASLKRLLEALEAAGVDNWSGYDDALDMLREDAA